MSTFFEETGRSYELSDGARPRRLWRKLRAWYRRRRDAAAARRYNAGGDAALALTQHPDGLQHKFGTKKPLGDHYDEAKAVAGAALARTQTPRGRSFKPPQGPPA